MCDAEDIDTVIKASFGRRLAVLGPMENADLVGLELTLAIHDYVLPTLDPPSEPVARPAPSASSRASSGWPTGRGWRKWTPEQAAETRRRMLEHLAAAGEPLADRPPAEVERLGGVVLRDEVRAGRDHVALVGEQPVARALGEQRRPGR